MAGKRYTEEQIAFAIRQHESGTAIAEITRKTGIAEQTFYRRKKKYAGMGVAELRIRLRDLAASRVRYGYRRLHTLLKREGWQVNHKLIYRLYLEEGLQMRTKTPRRNKSCRARVERPKATHINESWSMDFMSEQFFDG